MPWAGNESLDLRYWCVTWYPQAEDMADALALVTLWCPGGFEYEDGAMLAPLFTDIPREPGRPFVRVYLAMDQATDAKEAIFKGCGERGWPVHTETVDSQDWANAWKSYWKPQEVASDYAIVPLWYENSPKDLAHTLWLDPGMAFGTGTHPTTRMCLNALAKLDLTNQTVLDLGAGSGILGLFAGLLGARQVVLVEPDPVAVAAIRHNAAFNSLGDRVVVVLGTLEALKPFGFDILCLNLIWDIIQTEWGRIQNYLASAGATLILSGLLKARRQEITRLVESTGQHISGVEEDAGWLAVTVRHGSPRG